jgi:hypothetical protein
MQQVSSGATLLIQYAVYPLTVAVAVASGTWQLIYQPHAWTVAVMGLAVVTCAWITPWIYRCTRVVITPGGLRVGKTGHERDVPWADISSVSSYRWSNPPVVSVLLASGDRVVFFAESRAFAFRGELPVVEQLRSRIARPVT